LYGLLRQSLSGVAQPSLATPGRLNWRIVGRTVILLGLTSLLTDISSEMVSAVLPLYLLYQLQASAFQLGVVDGLYQGASGLVRLAAALSADRWQRQKEVATAGYALSAVSRIGLLAAGSALQAVAGSVLVDRIGKGIRTAPRDALISLSVPRERLGVAFGVHRTFDTGGSLLGPLLAFGLLTLAPTAFDAVFVPSFCIGLLGLGVIVLFVSNPRVGGRAPAPPTFRECARLLTMPRFRILVLAAGALTLFTASDAFIYIGLQRRSSLALSYFPLLYVATATFYLLLALPAGRLADRIGRRRVFLAGQVGMLATLGLLLLPAPSWLMVLVLPVLGAYYALTDGVIMAAASAELSEGLRTSGLAVLTTVTSLGSLVSSVVLGTLWSTIGMQAAFTAFALGLAVVIAGSAWVLYRSAQR
jgi:MFS family permease